MSIFNKVHWWGADLLPGSIHTLLQGDYAAWVGSGWQHSEEISQFNSKEKTGAWRRLEEGGLMGWWVGDYRGRLSWHKHDNIQEAWSPFNTAASMLTTNRQLPVRGRQKMNTPDHREGREEDDSSDWPHVRSGPISCKKYCAIPTCCIWKIFQQYKV